MLIEVTEKEAMELYSQRYWESKGKVRYLPVLILVIAVIACSLVYSPDRQWLSLAIFVIITSPAVYISLKSARASGKYAKQQIGEPSPTLAEVNERIKKKERQLERLK